MNQLTVAYPIKNDDNLVDFNSVLDIAELELPKVSLMMSGHCSASVRFSPVGTVILITFKSHFVHLIRGAARGVWGSNPPLYKSLRFTNNELRRKTFHNHKNVLSRNCVTAHTLIVFATRASSCRLLYHCPTVSQISPQIVSDTRCAELSVVREIRVKVFEFALR